MSLIESLVPKSRFGFRTAHQPFPVDTVLFTALVAKIADTCEVGRDEVVESRSFSYRKNAGLNHPFFIEGHSYKDWISSLMFHLFSSEYSHAIRTDISDFYMRIYRHRLENILISLSGDAPTVRRIERFLSIWRGGQSFGLPVGTDACRFLAEMALNDVDMGLVSEDYRHSRYVDDIILLCKHGQDPYAILAHLAQTLSSNEGLSLNTQKTIIKDWNEFSQSFLDPSGEDEESKEHWATEKLFHAAYGNEELDSEALAVLMMKDLTKELENELMSEFWDMGHIRIILHAMRLVEDPKVSDYIRSNLARLVPFAKDVCLLIESFHKKGIPGFENLAGEVVDLLLSPRMRPLGASRAWFLELGVRGVANFSNADLKRLEALTEILDVRQLMLLRSRLGDVNFFRNRKSRVSEIQSWAQPTFIFGARCLPKDEYLHWARSIKSRLQFPLAGLFVDWCMATHGADPIDNGFVPERN